MKSFNLSTWAIEHRSLVWYFMLVASIAGILSYMNLGREEDPNFTVKTMLVTATWPGASVEDMENQVADRIEKKLEEITTLDYTRSQSSPGQTVVFINLLDTTQGNAVTESWLRVRNILSDIKGELPSGVKGPF